ncbi:MAG TPA: STY0301 family protein [Burkholderiales bacterium]|jgi:hypothetical protein|nr:STY0301 family protein [Burkholderiales bacterium]
MKSAARYSLRYPVIVVAVLAAAVLVTSSARAAQPKKPAPEPLGPSLCPETVNVEQRVTDPPQGWEPGLSGMKSQLAMVTFFDGPPGERASLKYDSELKQRGGTWVATWTLAPNGRGYWVQCAYDNTTAVLSRKLPETVKTCAVTYERTTKAANALPVVKHVVCK